MAEGLEGHFWDSILLLLHETSAALMRLAHIGVHSSKELQLVQRLKVTLGISQQAGRPLRYKEMNGHSNELMDRFLPGLHAQEYHLVTLTAALQVDALSIYYAMVRFMPELQKLRHTGLLL